MFAAGFLVFPLCRRSQPCALIKAALAAHVTLNAAAGRRARRDAGGRPLTHPPALGLQCAGRHKHTRKRTLLGGLGHRFSLAGRAQQGG